MKYFLAICFLFAQLSVFCQTAKENYEFIVLETKETYILNSDNSRPYCDPRPSAVICQDSLTKFQKKLDDLNLSIKDKEYCYYMRVYGDYSYEIMKEYKSHFNEDGSSGATISGEEYRKFPNE